MSEEPLAFLAPLLSRDDVIFSYLKTDSQKPDMAAQALPAMAVAALKFAIEAYGVLSTMAWQSNVSNKLEEISRKLDQIILELQRLRNYIDERITQETLSIFNGEIEARRRTIEGILAGLGSLDAPLDAETRTRLIRIMDELDVPLWQLMNHTKFSFDPYPAVVSGVITKLLVLKMVGGSDGERQTFLRKAVEIYFMPALDPKVPNSIEANRNAAASEAIKRSGDLDGVLNRWWRIANHYRRIRIEDGFNEIEFCTQAAANGSVSGGLAFVERQEPQYVGVPYPGCDLRWDLTRFTADINTKIGALNAAITREALLRQHGSELASIAKMLLAYAEGRPSEG